MLDQQVALKSTSTLRQIPQKNILSVRTDLIFLSATRPGNTNQAKLTSSPPLLFLFHTYARYTKQQCMRAQIKVTTSLSLKCTHWHTQKNIRVGKA